MTMGMSAPNADLMRSLITSVLLRLRHLRLVVLFVEYDRGIAGGSDQVFATLRSYLAPVKRCRIRFLRIDNKHEGRALMKNGQTITMGGDNRYHEFSAWQKGVETINRLGIPCDLLLLVNDMFLAPGDSFLKDYAHRDLFQKCLTQRTIIGRIDSTGHHYTAYGHDLTRWVCTNCLLAPKAAVDTVGHLVTVQENINDFLEEDFPGAPIFKTDAPMNEAYKAWLEEWLTTRWHSRFTLGASTWRLFRTKVRNILNESLLTARFTEAGFPPQEYGEKKYY